MFDFKNNFKDAFTNLLALILAIMTAVQGYIATLGDGGINWFTFATTAIGAIIAWFTGKSRSGAAKPIVPPVQ